MRHGFSLVELSIVLVILGLLTGGILTGQSLIHASELRSISTDFQRYQGAIYSFRDKYFALPGDMTNATAFWGARDGVVGNNPSAAACFTTAGGTGVSAAATCNGNSDGTIGGWAGPYAEGYTAWQQLANAGLIEGSYTGVFNLTTGVLRGQNAPASKVSNAGFGLFYAATGTFGLVGSETAGNKISFGNNQGDEFRGAAIKPEDAWNIDTKMDDGLPGNGTMVIDAANGSACYVGAQATMTAYNLTDTGVDCSLRLLLR